MKIKDIKSWFEVAIPDPTIEQTCIQIGCHFEEFGEMVNSVNLGGTMMYAHVNEEANEFKIDTSDYYIHKVEDCDRKELLDSLCDQIVTAVGVAHMLGMDIEGALKEVNDSNHSKFEDGKAVFDDNGKITKGVNYRAPKLDKFI